MPIEVKVIEVSPDMAQVFLESNKINRRISQLSVNKYAKDMLSGDWKVTHQGLAFYEDGTLADGQHRLHAVVKSGCTCSFMVVTGLEKDSGVAIDQLRPRSVIDSIRVSDGPDWINKDVVAMVKVMAQDFCGTWSPTQTEVFAVKYKLPIITTLARLGGRKYQSTLTAAIALGYIYEDESKMDRLCEILISGVVKDKNETSAIRLRDFVMSDKFTSHASSNRKESHLKAQRAIRAFCKGEVLSKLYTPDSAIYVAKP